MCQIVSKGLQRQHAPKTMIPNTYEDGWAQCSEMFGHSTEQAFCRKPQGSAQMRTVCVEVLRRRCWRAKRVAKDEQRWVKMGIRWVNKSKMSDKMRQDGKNEGCLERFRTFAGG